MNQNYYPIDFEAQYEETSEKMLEISKKYRDRILSLKSEPSAQLDAELEQIQSEIEDRELQFRKESIYSQFASGQLMAEKRKQPPEMCPECGQELKKQEQCQLCGELFCRKCCSRQRTIPFVSREQRRCCEQCHWKFVKLFDNKDFYEEKEKLVNVLNFVRNKTNKLAEKLAAKTAEVDQYKNEKRNERIREKANQSKILQEEKRNKALEEEFRRVVAEKAQKIRQQQEEDQRRKEQEERKKEEDRKREEQLKREDERRREEERRKEEEEKRKEERWLAEAKKQQKAAEKIGSKPETEADRQNQVRRKKEKLAEEALRKKQEEIKKREQQLLRKEKEMQRLEEQRNKSIREKSNKSSSSRLEDSLKDVQTPKNSLGNNSQKERAGNTADSNTRSRRESQQLPPRPQLVSNKSSGNLPKGKVEIETEVRPKNTETKVEAQADSLQKSLANMFKPRKDDDNKSIYSSVSKTSKSVLDMSVNELLAVRIPLARATSRQEEENPPIQTPPPVVAAVNNSETNFRLSYNQESASPKRASISVPAIVEEEQVRMSRDAILRNSSLITSQNTQNSELQTGPEKKCACIVM